MKKELEDELITAFPKLYRQYNLTIMESCMAWGFECPDEWFEPIWELSERITNYTETTGVVIEAAQVKEKFGGLRFYYDIKTDKKLDYDYIYDYINDIIIDAERKVLEIEEKKR